MNHDDHVIPYEEAVRRHRALEERKRKGIIHEVKISEAMSHLLEEQVVQDEEGPTPAHLRSIVEREFSEEDERSSGEPDECSQGDGDEVFCTLERRPGEAEEGSSAPAEPSEDPRRRQP
jgi:hypothetical protein